MTRWISYAHGEGDRVGVVRDGTIFGLKPGASLRGMLESGALDDAARRAVEWPFETAPLADVQIRPLLIPPSLRDSMCFHQHIRNCRPTEVEPRHQQYPIFYFSNPQSIIGARDQVRISPESRKFDYELEVGAIIGTAGENMSPQQA
jgi:2-keto-4-pentenoate hydratase/2-oxohepta-3-ene-1,7-dioic acid hydratase in catechol pathway